MNGADGLLINKTLEQNVVGILLLILWLIKRGTGLLGF